MRYSIDSTQKENKRYCNIRITSVDKCGEAKSWLVHKWLYLSRDTITKSRTPDFAHLLPVSRMSEAFTISPPIPFFDPSIRNTFAFKCLSAQNDFFAC